MHAFLLSSRFCSVPKQRLLKYPLLLIDLLKNTPSVHPEHASIVAALQNAQVKTKAYVHIYVFSLNVFLKNIYIYDIKGFYACI